MIWHLFKLTTAWQGKRGCTEIQLLSSVSDNFFRHLEVPSADVFPCTINTGVWMSGTPSPFTAGLGQKGCPQRGFPFESLISVFTEMIPISPFNRGTSVTWKRTWVLKPCCLSQDVSAFLHPLGWSQWTQFRGGVAVTSFFLPDDVCCSLALEG